MKDPRNNKDKYLRPYEAPSDREIRMAVDRLILREVAAMRQSELDRAIAEYEWSTGR